MLSTQCDETKGGRRLLRARSWCCLLALAALNHFLFVGSEGGARRRASTPPYVHRGSQKLGLVKPPLVEEEGSPR